MTHTSLIPVQTDSPEDEASESPIFYDYEPEEAEILSALLPRNMSTQIFSALLESSAAELAARMTAMDNATRNAGDMICLLYTSPSPRDRSLSRMPSSA